VIGSALAAAIAGAAVAPTSTAITAASGSTQILSAAAVSAIRIVAVAGAGAPIAIGGALFVRTLACAAAAALLVLIVRHSPVCSHAPTVVVVSVTISVLLGFHSALVLLCAAHRLLILHCCSRCISFSLRSVGDAARVPVHSLSGVFLFVFIAVNGLSFVALVATLGSFSVHRATLSPWALATSTSISFAAVFAALAAAYATNHPPPLLALRLVVARLLAPRALRFLRSLRFFVPGVQC